MVLLDDRPVAPVRSSLRPLLWRLHFFTGFLAAPVVVWLCLSGILFAWNPQIEQALYGDRLRAGGGEARPLSEQVAAAVAAYPGHEVVEVRPAPKPGATTGVLLTPPGAEAAGFGPAPGAFTVYVDPGTATVTGRIVESRRPDEWLRNLHSNFRLGSWADTLTELAGSLALVSLISGLYLWWPRTRAALRRSLVPRLRGLRAGGRRPWRDLHASLGGLTLAALAVLVVTGLTWTDHAGRWVDVAKTALVADPPALRTALSSEPPPGAHGFDSDEFQPSRTFGGSHGAHHAGHEHGAAAGATDWRDLDRVVAAADGAGLRKPYVVKPRPAVHEAWTVAEIDNRWPIDEVSVAIDPHTGNVVDRLTFADQPWLEQATTIGIGFHEGTLFGLANQIGLTVLAVALLAMVVSGYVMWWRRRPAGAFAAPPSPGPLLRTVPLPLLAGFGLLLVLLPTLGVGFVAYLGLERLVRRYQPSR